MAKEEIKNTIFEHEEFVAFSTQMDRLFKEWKTENTNKLKALTKGFKPKKLILTLSEHLLKQYDNKALIDKYDMYQHLMTYWFDAMQDDCYLVAQDEWKAETYRILKPNSKKKMIDKGWDCELVPKDLVTNRYFAAEKENIAALQAEKESIASELTEMVEEHSSEEGFFAEMEKVNKATTTARIKELKGETDVAEELKVLKQYIALLNKQTATNKKIKTAEADLDAKLYAKYPSLSETEIKQLVVDDKWMHSIETTIQDEIDHISQRLTNRIKELAERYESPLPLLDKKVDNLESKVTAHLQKMGFVWN